jgi:hypothetical protein
MKKHLIITMIVILILSICGCSAGVANEATDRQKTAATTTAGYAPGGDNKEDDASTPEAPVERKIIQDATLDIESSDVIKTYEQLLTWATQHDGYETRRNQNRSDDYISIDAEIKIPPEHLDAFLDYAETTGTVINRNVNSSDITESYYDTQTRLQTMEQSLERYYDFLEKAESIEESLQVQYEINRVTVEIESLKGRLKLWDSLLAESVVTIRVRQTEDPVKLKKEIDWSTLSLEDMVYLMRSGLTRMANVIVNLLQWLLVILVVTSPLWIIALVLIFVLRHRKKKKRSQAAMDENGPVNPNNQNQ